LAAAGIQDMKDRAAALSWLLRKTDAGAKTLPGGADHAAIQRGMAAIAADIEAGRFEWKLELEDVHLNIEARLTQLVGDAGKRLHTARSRNDQVATDLRLWLRAEIDDLTEALHKIVSWSKAYPLDIFPEPDTKKAHEVLRAHGMTIDSISASAARHVVEGIGKIARSALGEKQ
jgi:hypothetical protein